MVLRTAAALLLSALAILWLGEFTAVDMLLARAAYDPVLREFPWRHAWLAETVGHGLLRDLCVAAGAMVIAVTLYDARFGLFGAWVRLRMRFLALCAVLVPLSVSAAKQASSLSCPWDLRAFNGTQPYFRLLDSIPHGAHAGHCWPGGHASGFLWILGIVVFWLPHRPRHAAVVAVLVLAAGLGVGWIQQLRGAHFLSHTLWSMWIASAVTALLWHVLDGAYARARSGSGP